jgi:hypothetical protein
MTILVSATLWDGYVKCGFGDALPPMTILVSATLWDGYDNTKC